MARLATVVLALVTCFFLVIPQIAIAQVSPSRPAAPVFSPTTSEITPVTTEASQASSSPVAQSTSVPPPSPSPSPTPVPASSTAAESSAPPSTTQESSAPPSSSVYPTTVVSSSAPASSKSTIKYSYNKSNFIYNSTINGKVVTITSTSNAPPVPTHTSQGSNAKVNTTHVIIAISSIGGVAILSTVGFAWMKLYKGRRGGWDDDELMNSSSYGNSAQADPFKSTLDQYHRS